MSWSKKMGVYTLSLILFLIVVFYFLKKIASSDGSAKTKNNDTPHKKLSRLESYDTQNNTPENSEERDLYGLSTNEILKRKNRGILETPNLLNEASEKLKDLEINEEKEVNDSLDPKKEAEMAVKAFGKDFPKIGWVDVIDEYRWEENCAIQNED
ncbi:hypothetical protein H311_04138 [Anncaliia algerae PRA109]|nr:hypothetical protein H311_04138 [Anncaliia algerae PRA109]